MLEKIAISIATARGLAPRTLPVEEALWLYYPKEKALDEARAAVEALRDPSDEILSAPGLPYQGNVSHAFGLQQRREAWNKMLDAILAGAA